MSHFALSVDQRVKINAEIWEHMNQILERVFELDEPDLIKRVANTLEKRYAWLAGFVVKFAQDESSMSSMLKCRDEMSQKGVKGHCTAKGGGR